MTTLGQYMAWLNSIGGHCVSGVGVDSERGMVPSIRFHSPEGLTATVTGLAQKDELSPYLIENLDRRLLVVSPFPHRKKN